MPRPPIVDLIVQRGREQPNNPYLRFKGETVSWSAFADGMWRAANRLRLAGVEPGDRVCLMLPNCPERKVWAMSPEPRA